uniref:Uncharacterized protein n=1 Tax=Lepeophtheirus salmonis TaxID=72036 RepID=A0A0K2VC90_LEPSM
MLSCHDVLSDLQVAMTRGKQIHRREIFRCRFSFYSKSNKELYI